MTVLAMDLNWGNYVGKSRLFKKRNLLKRMKILNIGRRNFVGKDGDYETAYTFQTGIAVKNKCMNPTERNSIYQVLDIVAT